MPLTDRHRIYFTFPCKGFACCIITLLCLWPSAQAQEIEITTVPANFELAAAALANETWKADTIPTGEGRVADSVLVPGYISFKEEELKKGPLRFADIDIFHLIQYTPQANAFVVNSNSLAIRGARDFNNRMLVEDVPLFNTQYNTLYPQISSQVIESLELFSGAMPAAYNGFTGSLSAIKLREGDYQDYHSTAGINLRAMHFFSEGPIRKGRSSFLFSANSSFLSMLTNSIFSLLLDYPYNTRTGIHDYTLRFNHKLTSNSKLSFIALQGEEISVNKYDYNDEESYYQVKSRFRNGTSLQLIKWEYDGWENDRMTIQIDRSTSRLSRTEVSRNPSTWINWYSGRRDLSFRIKDTHHFNHAMNIETGLSTSLINCFPYKYSRYSIIDFSIGNRATGATNLEAIQWQYYADLGIKLGSKTTMQLGSNVLGTFYNGNHELAIDPRASISWEAMRFLTFALSASKLSQQLHLFGSNGENTSALWIPVDDELEASESWIVNARAKCEFAGDYSIQADVYYREAPKLIYPYTEYEYLYEPNFALPSINYGWGKNHGAEIMLSKTRGALQGSIIYSYIKNEENYESLGNLIPSFLSPHALKAFVYFSPNERLAFNAHASLHRNPLMVLPDLHYDLTIYQYLDVNLGFYLTLYKTKAKSRRALTFGLGEYMANSWIPVPFLKYEISF